jgi:23S rRNA pseudouridine1911/1915/1917 synthase
MSPDASPQSGVAIGDSITVTPEFIGRRLDQYLTEQLVISRARVQMLLEQSGVTVDGKAAKPSMKLRGGEQIAILAAPEPPPLRATPEDIPLEIVYEDDDLAVINKPPGMMVHAGAGNSSAGSDEMLDDPRQSGTLVNALLHHLQQLSSGGDGESEQGSLRPGIVHRLDKNTSGLMVVAKNDAAHAKLSDMFARRQVKKTYIALVHGTLKQPNGTINTPIARDAVRRTRMTTRREGGRPAVSHYKELRFIDGPYGKFTLVEVRIETGRTHQIRVHMSSIGHPVVGDTLYGAQGSIPLQATLNKKGKRPTAEEQARISLDRNFLHAAKLQLNHPRTAKPLAFEAPLPADLVAYMDRLMPPSP